MTPTQEILGMNHQSTAQDTGVDDDLILPLIRHWIPANVTLLAVEEINAFAAG